MSVAERLVEIREKYGYTRKKLADELGRPYRTITKYETGEREPGHSYIVEIAKKFGVSTDYILGATDVMTLETKKSPGTTEVAPGEEEIFRLATALNDMLVAQGVIQDGNDLTDRQSEVLIAVCRIIDATFKD